MNARWNLYLAGFLPLSLGILAYFLDRPAGDLYLLPDALSAVQGHSWDLHDSLPTLLHALAFCLLLGAVVPVPYASAGRLCIGWWLAETLLETAQHPAFAPSLATPLPAWLDALPVLEALPDYLLRGTFDLWDIGFAGIGCLCAFPLLQHVLRGGASNG